MRLLGHMATTEVTPDTICNQAGHVALGYLYGTSETGFDPRTRDSARCILVWGANPSACGPHQDEHWLGEAQGTVVVVRPDQDADGGARRHPPGSRGRAPTRRWRSG